MLYIDFSHRSPDNTQSKLRFSYDNFNELQELNISLETIEEIISVIENYNTMPNTLESVSIGQKLYNWLDSEYRFLTRAIELCRQENVEQLILAFANNRKFTLLPWEILHDGEMFLIEHDYPIVSPIRCCIKTNKKERVENRPLNVIFMASSPIMPSFPISSFPELDFEKEEALILQATDKQPLSLTVEESGNLGELKNLIDSYDDGYFDVFHLTGHASIIEDKGPVFFTETETGEIVDSNAINIMEALNRVPKLIFLSGCCTGEARNNEKFTPLAEELVRLGARAVLSWGHTVTDDSASVAAAVLYEELSKGYDIIKSFAKTYKALKKNAEKIKSNDWQFLRLYTACDPTSRLVTPIKTMGRKALLPRKATDCFLDDQERIKVPDLYAFVGRRRVLQRCMKVLYYAQDKIGVFLHGIGGIGKSSIAARLCSRMINHKIIVWVGKIDEHVLVNKLKDNIIEKDLRNVIMNTDDELKYKLWDFFRQSPDSFLLVFDDLEYNMEYDGGKLKLPCGIPVLSLKAESVLNAIVFAITKTSNQHKIIITSRYKVKTKLTESFYFEQITAFKDTEIKKKLDQLKYTRGPVVVPIEFKKLAVKIADGNPLLLERLYEILIEKRLEDEQLSKLIKSKELELSNEMRLDSLLKDQPIDLKRMLAASSVYELAIPKEVIEDICTDIKNLDIYINHSVVFGMLENIIMVKNSYFRVPTILKPLLEVYLPDNRKAFYCKAADVLDDIIDKANLAYFNSYAWEIHRLLLLGNDHEKSIEKCVSLTNVLLTQGRAQDMINLCSTTMKMVGNNSNLLCIKADAELLKGKTKEAEEQYTYALNVCTDNDKEIRSRILYGLSNIYTLFGDMKKANVFFNMSRDIDIYPNNGWVDSANLHMEATIYSHQADNDKALTLYYQALTIKERENDLPGMAATLHQIGSIYYRQDKISDALDKFQRSIEIKEMLGNMQGKAITLILMSEMLVFMTDDFDIAIAHLTDAIVICKEFGVSRKKDAQQLMDLALGLKNQKNTLTKKKWLELKQIRKEKHFGKLKNIIFKEKSFINNANEQNRIKKKLAKRKTTTMSRRQSRRKKK